MTDREQYTPGPAYFRVELSGAKLLGVALMLAPVPARLKEWGYAGFAINIASALITHLSVGDGPEAWGFAAATGVLWGLSYCFWRRVQATAAGVRGGGDELLSNQKGLPSAEGAGYARRS